jgi:hypothetical protein
MFVATGRVSVEKLIKITVHRPWRRFAYGMRVCYPKVQRMATIVRSTKGCHIERKQVVIQDDIIQG